jgi:peptidoglycan hydrolase CwlO-like protein
MGKGGKRLQTSNQEIELLQQDLEDALQEIDRLQKQNQSIIGKVEEFMTQDNELYHEFVCSATPHIDTLEEKLTSVDKFMGDVFKIEDQKDKLIESL